jgi:hypothetical protein
VHVEESRSDVLGDTNMHMQGPSQIEKKGAHVQDDIKCGYLYQVQPSLHKNELA